MKIRFKRSTIRRTTAFSRDFDFKPWCEEKGVATSEIDFAFYNRRSGLCLIATSEANHLKLKGVRTKVLLSGLITHASVNEHATAMDALKLVSFWAAVIKQ